MGSFAQRGRVLKYEHQKICRTEMENVSQKYNQTVEDMDAHSEDFEVGEDIQNHKVTVFDQIKKPKSALGRYPEKLLAGT